MATFNKFLNSFNLENTKGTQFEHFVKWFLKNDPEWITQVDEVWLWDEYPDRWGPDCGVDLVFRHKNGETWAVQAKCYDTKYSITKKDVDTFLSESNRQGIDKRLLIASTDQVGRNARQVCQAQEKPVTLYLYADFDKAAIDYPSDISQLASAKRKELPTPRPHQIEAIESVINGFENADRGQMIMACGTGKTYTTLWVKEALNAKTTLVLLPSLSLLSQTLREWASAANESFEALCVCSDETVGKQSNDELISSVQDVAFPTTSDPQVIKSFLDRDVSKVVFSTYHSSPSIAEAQSDNNYQAFDLVIADEAHRCTGEAGKAFTTVLDDSLIKAKKRLFTTATPRTYSTNIKKKASEIGIDIADMSDEASFGREFHNLTFAQAIDKKLLTDYRVVIIGVDEPMISKWIKRRELVRTDTGEIIDAKTLASQIGLIKAIKDYDLKRMISFHSRVKSAEWFAKDLHNAMDFVSDEHRPEGGVYTDFVSGKMSSYDRGLKLSQLKKLHNADRGLLTNARCLSEGVDVPSLDGVAFIDPRSSQVDIVQAVGRAIRKSNNKTIGTILLPVFIENADNAEESLQSSNFKPIWGVLNALKSHDETLSLELDQLRTNLGRQGGSGSAGDLPAKVVFDLPKTVDKRFSDALRTFAIDKTTDSWEFWYGLLINYLEENKNLLVPRGYKTSDGFNLQAWVRQQRDYKKNNILKFAREQKLDELGFVWDVLEYQWNYNYKLLKECLKERGNTLVPQDFVYKGVKLGVWASSQRIHETELTIERHKKLEELGFTWNVDDYYWNTGYKHLEDYYKTNGDTLVVWRHKVDGFTLGAWVAGQRRNKANNTLTLEKIEKLDEIGFAWDVQEYLWNQGFQHLKEYVDIYHNSLVPGRYTINDFGLGNWVLKQRSNKDNLSTKQVNSLKALGFVWGVDEYNWERGYQLLKRYVQENNINKVPTNYKVDGFSLGVWTKTQRRQHEKLSTEKIKKLEDLGFIWNVSYETKWNEGYEYLRQYVANNATTLVPMKCKVDGFTLGKWVGQQRGRKDKLSSGQISKLDDLEFVWNIGDYQWNNNYKLLVEYCDKYGDTLVSIRYKTNDGFNLGHWVSNIRSKPDRVSEENKRKLSGISFIWDIFEYRWDKGYQHLKQYAKDNGNASVAQKYKTDGFNLGSWASHQRQNKEELSPERIKKLDDLGFVWSVKNY